MAKVKHLRGKELYQLVFYGVILVVAAVGTLAYWGVREIRRDAAMVAVESSARGLSGAVTVLLNAVRNSNDEISDGTFSSLKPQTLRKEFRDLFSKHSTVKAILVSDGQGLKYMLARRGMGIVEGVPGEDNHSSMKWTMFKGDGTIDTAFNGWALDRASVDRVLSDEFSYLKPGEVNWRSASRAFNARESLVSASSLMETVQGRKVMVSFAFPVSGVVSQLGGAERGGAERVFLYWNNGTALPVTGLGAGETGSNPTSRALAATEITDSVISKAVSGLAAVGDVPRTPFPFTVEGEVWWTYALPLSIFGDTMSLGVAVPRRNVVSTLTSDTFLQAGATILIVAAALILFILHRNRSRIEALGLRREAAENDDDVLALIASGENGRLEFKQTLRFNLKSEKNGREIEHASLKTVSAFMNSDGGTLLIGVADDGTVTGFAEDQFGTGDHALLHFNNLVNQHIGPEFSRYIDAAIIPVHGQDVLRIHCIPAPVPAVLDMKKGEEFYVRSGPASRSLSLSQFYEWLKDH
nr:ATP-binding protein [uncultured Pseudodesulfovibrio sp.]